MAITGKKINELDSVTSLTDDSVLPIVKIESGTAENTAKKVAISQIYNYLGISNTVKNPIIVEDLISTSITLAEAKANTIYKYGTLTNLTITANETSDQETVIYFTTGATISCSFPNSLKWISDNTLEPEINTSYVISIINNIAVWGSFD